MRLQRSLPDISEATPRRQESSISVYSGQLTAQTIVTEVKKMKAAFPELPAGFYEILSQRVKANKFCDARLTDAVNNLIDNFTYPRPTIADVISYDKRVRLYTYAQVCELVSQGHRMEDYVKLPDRKAWMSKEDSLKINQSK